MEKIKAMLIYDKMIPSVKLCIYEQLKFLSEKRKIEFKLRQRNKLKIEDFFSINVVFFVRSDSIIESNISKMLKKKGICCVYVIDDDLLNVPSNISSFKYYNLNIVRKNILNIMKNCDILISPSKNLLKKYSYIFKYNIEIDEPTIFYRNKSLENERILKIGFAGTIDREDDFKLGLEKAIEKIHEKYKNKVIFEFFGAKPSIVNKLNLTWHPYLDEYEEYVEKMKIFKWDIGLAPMANTDFHKCKYHNKYIEYGSYGIVGIYSNLEPYIYKINNGINGYLVDNTEEDWYEKLEYCLKNKYELIKLKKNIIQDIENNYNIEIISNNFYKDMSSILFNKEFSYIYKNNHFDSLYLKMTKIVNLILKVIIFFKINRRDSFIKVLKRIM